MAYNRYSYQRDLDSKYRSIDKKILKSKELLNIALQYFDGCMIEKNESDDFIKAKDFLARDKEFGDDILYFYNKQYMKNNEYREYKDYFQKLKSVVEKVISIIVARKKK